MGVATSEYGNIRAVVVVAPDDVKPMVDRMLELLSEPQPQSRWRGIRDLLLGRDHRDSERRRNGIALFSDIRRRLDDPAERFTDEGYHLVRWLDWDSDLERQPEEVGRLASRIQQALRLLERSRTP